MEEVKDMEQQVETEKTVFEEMQTAFQDAGQREKLVYVSAALSAGAVPSKAKRFMTLNLDNAQMAEMMVALIDGLPDETLEVFSGGGISAEDMKTFRINSRTDASLEMLMQEMHDLSDTMTNLVDQRDIKNILKSIRGVKKDIDYIKDNMPLAIKAEDAETTSTEVDGAERIEESTEMKAEETANDAVTSTVEAETEGGDREPDAYYYDGATFEKAAKTKDDNIRSRILAFFRRANTDKVEHDEETKKESVMEFLKSGLADDQLEAALEACRAGVPYEHLQYIVDKQGSANKIRLMSKLYMYIFSGEEAAAAMA